MPGQVYRNPRTGAPSAEPIGWRPIGASTPDAPTLGGSIESWAATLPERQRAQIEGRKYVEPAEAEDPIALPEVLAPSAFRGGNDDLAAKAAEGLKLAQAPFEVPDESGMLAELQRAREGFMVDDDDITKIRAGVPDFLARGNAEREARDAVSAQSVFPWGRTESDRVRDDTAFRGLQQARAMTDPRYRREQDQLDELARAETFMDPRVMAARQSSREDAIAEARGLKELGLTLGLDPRAQKLEDLDFGRRIKLAEAQGMARNPFGAMLAGGGRGAAPNSSAPRGTPMTEAEIRQKVIAMGGSENDVLDTIEEARAAGLLR